MTKEGGAPRYEIKTVTDFLKVPPDRIEACLQEFKTWCEITRPLEDGIKAIAEAIMEGDMRLEFTHGFTWIDDGEQNVQVNFHAHPNNPNGGAE